MSKDKSNDLLLNEVAQLKEKVEDLQSELRYKNREVEIYKKELIKFSNNLDMILSSSQQDVKALNSLHKAIVPTALPQFAGFEISRKFTYGTKQGGDYFDIFPHEDKMKFSILLASSSGYAMSAAFLSVVLQQSSILEGRKTLSVEDTVRQLAGELVKIAAPQDETQLFYAVVDRRHMTMNFSCLGKIAGLIQSTDQSANESIKIISSDSKGIAVNRKIDYSSLEVDLKPGYRICLLSEGLVNAMDTDELVSVAEETVTGGVHEIRNQMFIQAQIKSGLEQPIKDQTVIVIEVKDNVMKLAK
jgi:phosphoserine phosphatase RsbU/P